MTAATSYNEIPYECNPYPQTHPDRLAAIARFFSLNSQPVEKCKVLEIGCASGNNLIPMAEHLPNSTFLGIDFSEKQIAQGKAFAQSLGLNNLELRCQDLKDFNTKEGKFDYIIAHGIFSWIDAAAQNRLFEICKKHLAPTGVAFVSYNVLPGWHMRGMVRDMMRFHSRKFSDNGIKVAQGRALLEFLANAGSDEKNPYRLFLKSEVELMRAQNDSYLFHEHLEEINSPMYFNEFASAAAKGGLKYLGDSDIRTMGMADLSVPVQQMLATTGNLIETEQYLDFLRNRMFRMSLLVHEEQVPVYNIRAGQVADFHLASSLAPIDANAHLHSQDKLEFSCYGVSAVTLTDPFMKAALVALFEKWPGTLQVDELLQIASKKLGLEAPKEGKARENLVDLIGTALFSYYTTLPMGAVELFTRSIPGAPVKSEQPRASRLARAQAATSLTVTNSRHQVFRMGDFEHRLINWMDGKRKTSDMVEELTQMVRTQAISIQDGGVLVTDEARAREMLRQRVELAVQMLGKNALLAA